MRKKLFATRRRRVILAVLVPLALAGVAFATWSILRDNAPGAGRTGAIVAPTVVAASDSELSGLEYDQAFPNEFGDVVMKVTNPNGIPVTPTSVTDDGAVIRNDDETACPMSNFQRGNALGITFAGGDGSDANGATVAAETTEFVVVKDSYKLSSSAPNGCQGRRVTTTWDITFQSG